MSRPRCAPARDDGSALVEFVGVAVVLLLPLVYLLLTVFTVQRAAFGVDEAAREAGRAFATSSSTVQALARAQLAADIAMQDQGFAAAPVVRYTRDPSGCGGAAVTPLLLPGAGYDVCVVQPVALPFTGNRLLGRLVAARLRVVGRYLLIVDSFRPAR